MSKTSHFVIFKAILKSIRNFFPISRIWIRLKRTYGSHIYIPTYDLYNDLLDKHTAAEKRKAEIETEAAKERTQWEVVIDTFNARFFVPFKLEPPNNPGVIWPEVVQFG